MNAADLDVMADLLGDPAVMRFYPRPKTRDEAMRWIAWSQANYAEYGYGLWIIETHDGDFVGDCGLTWQPVGDVLALEVGYHTAPAQQGCGYATEAARACLDLAMGPIGASHVVAIINPANIPSRRVAEKLGMRAEQETEFHGRPVVVYGRTAIDDREGPGADLDDTRLYTANDRADQLALSAACADGLSWRKPLVPGMLR